MSIWADIRDHLADQAAVTAITSRIRCGMGDQADTLPYIVIVPESESRQYSSGGGSGTANMTLSVLCVANTVEQCEELKEAVRDRLDTLKQVIGSSDVRKCLLTSVTWDVLESRQGEERGPTVARMMFGITITEAAPSIRS